MSHAAHRAQKGAKPRFFATSALLRGASQSSFPSHAKHKNGAHGITQRVASAQSGTVQVAANNGAVVDLDADLVRNINASAPLTRKALRQERKMQSHRSQLMASVSLAALVGMTATSAAFSGRATGLNTAGESTNTITRSIAPVGSAAASRSSDRDSLSATVVKDGKAQTFSGGKWQLGSSVGLDADQMSKSTAVNPTVASFMDEDYAALPAGFNPNHDSGDTGNAYDFSECTWWVYTRRQQLGLPVGSHMGDGYMWADSARSLGYWVDSTARHVGDIMVFARGQNDADAQYGHVAIIEKINPDGSVETSECGASHHGVAFSRTFSADQVRQLQIIHY